LVELLAVHAIALARLRAAGAPGSLDGLDFRGGDDDERVHAGARVVAFLFDEAAVDYEADAVNGQRGLGDVRREDDLARVLLYSRAEDLALVLGRLRSVECEDQHRGHLCAALL